MTWTVNCSRQEAWELLPAPVLWQPRSCGLWSPHMFQALPGTLLEEHCSHFRRPNCYLSATHVLLSSVGVSFFHFSAVLSAERFITNQDLCQPHPRVGDEKIVYNIYRLGQIKYLNIKFLSNKDVQLYLMFMMN